MSDTEDQTEAELEKTRAVVAEMTAAQAEAAEQVLTEPEPEEAPADKWDGWTVEELKDALSDADLKVSGNRDELIARLNEAGVEPGEG